MVMKRKRKMMRIMHVNRALEEEKNQPYYMSLFCLLHCLSIHVMLKPIEGEEEGFEYIDDVIKRAQENAASYMSGKDIGKPVFGSEQMVVDVGNLNNGNMRSLSDNAKIAISACYKVLEKNKTIEETLQDMVTNAVLAPDHGAAVSSKALDYTQIKHLDYWLYNLTNNLELLAATHILGDPSIKISEVGWKILEKNHCNKERDIIDLSVLQLPQPNKSEEFFVGQIKATVWSDSKKAGGVKLEYITRKFTPRYSVISKMGETSKQNAITLFEERFAKIGPREMPPKLEPLPSPSKGSSSNIPSVTCGGTSWNSSTALTFAAAAFTAFTIMKRNGDEEEEEDDEDDVCE